LETEIRLIYKDPKEAKAVYEAISPDNVETPTDLLVQTFWTENAVKTTVKYGGDNVMTFLSTIDDILSCVSVAEKAFMATKRMKHSSQ
jgi:hypothetical protein